MYNKESWKTSKIFRLLTLMFESIIQKQQLIIRGNKKCVLPHPVSIGMLPTRLSWN